MAKKADDIISRIQDIIKDSDTHEPETQFEEGDYDDFLKKVKKNVGKDSVLRHEQKGRVLMVWVSRDAYKSKQELFTTQGKQDWLYDNGIVLLSVHYDTEPNSVKLYFTKYKNVGE